MAVSDLSTEHQRMLLDLVVAGKTLVLCAGQVRASGDLLNGLTVGSDTHFAFRTTDPVSGRSFEESYFEFLSVGQGEWEVLSTTDTGFPFLLPKAVGKGHIFFCAAPFGVFRVPWR